MYLEIFSKLQFLYRFELEQHFRRKIHIAVEIQILKLPLFRQLMINFSLACELLLSQIFLNKCSASTTESTIPFAKKFS